MSMTHNSLSALRDSIEARAREGDLETPLEMIQNFVEGIVSDALATGRVFSAPALDALCLRLGAQMLSQIHGVMPSISERRIVYVATEFGHGGHTLLAADFVRYMPDHEHIFLITDLFGNRHRDASDLRLVPLGARVEMAPGGSRLEKLMWLLTRLSQLAPERIYWFNHHQDAVAIAAAQPEIPGEKYFIHHADHQLCLGVHLPHLNHVDLTNLGFFNCRDVLGIANNHYWPLVCDDLGPRDQGRGFIAAGRLRTCTSGSGNKFEIPYLHDYADVVARMLRATGGDHVHVGYLSEEYLERIHRRLADEEIPPERLIHMPWVPSLWRTLIDREVDVYLMSWPIGGGKALIEAMGAGISPVIHVNYISRFHSGFDLGYAKALTWRTPADLIEQLMELTPERLAVQSCAARAHYKRHHIPEILASLLRQGDAGVAPGPIPLRGYHPDALQVFLDERAQHDAQLAAHRKDAIRLEQAVTDRDQQVVSLNQTVAEHETQIGDLNQRVAERDGQIFWLNQAVRDARRELEQVLASRSWRITKPLRFARRVAVSQPYAAFRRAVSNGSRALWHALPMSFDTKGKLKGYIFGSFAWMFRWSRAYQAWESFNAPITPARVTSRIAALRPAMNHGEYVPLLDGKPLEERPAKLICFYLPQFYPIPENDEWWGEGFTEWAKVRPAEAQFVGHYQPHVPGELGYYNLLDPAVQRRQVELARLYGIEGFCFYFYWFGGKRPLEASIENYLSDSSLDLPFCLCWANENWSRRWDGLDSEILIAQQHSPEDDLAFIQHIAKYMHDVRYIRVGDRPLLLVYRPGLLPSAKETAARWRNWCRANGIGEIYLAYTQSFDKVNPAKYGFDAAIEFPPNNSAPPNITDSVTPLGEEFGCTVYDWRVFVERSEKYRRPNYKLFRSVCPSWDNTARRKNRGTVFLNSTPLLYQRWLENAIRDSGQHHATPDERLIFVNAWNEWAEGAHLEPDMRYGYAYLQATRNALSGESYVPGTCRKIVLVAHDAHPHGAQLLVRNLAETLSRGLGFHVDLVCLGNGRLKTEYAKWATLHDLAGTDARGPEAISLAKELYESGSRSALVNTTVSGYFLETLATQGFKCVALIHELRGVLDQLNLHGQAASIATHASRIVFPAVEVTASFNNVAQVTPDKIVIRPQGLYKRRGKSADRATDRKRLRQKFGLSDDSQIILGVGYADHRKGIDLFVEAGLQLAERAPQARWVWIGHWEQSMQREVEKKIAQFPTLKDRFIFPGLQSDTDLFYGGADVFALTSREDPFPSVVLEALEAGVPVVGFEAAGGFIGLLNEGCGRLVAKEDTKALADAVGEMLEAPHEREVLGRRGVELINERFSFRHYVFDMLDLLGTKMERISVIVPNYNYAQYLPERLSSIIKQDYPVYEIIILDDRSTDESVSVAREILEPAGIDYKIVVNDKNSGSVFRQWKKGVDLASGTYVWIAEADDSCGAGFLAEVINGFRTPGVVLSYCESRQMADDGRILSGNYLDYVADVNEHQWLGAFVRDGHEQIVRSLSIKNTIPNVSAVLFERNIIKSVLDKDIELICSYRIAGDWLVYAMVLEKGKIAFSPAPLNMHRRHNRGLTIGNLNRPQLEEIRRMQEFVADRHDVPAERKAAARKYIESLSRQFELVVT
jgi:glycosyltransferase involved in cell wall biosynthesis